MRGTTATALLGLMLAVALAGAGLPATGAGTETGTGTGSGTGSGTGADADAADAAIHVHMDGFAFVPATVSILVGEAVEWDNHDVVLHTVTADDGSFDSGDMGNGATYVHTFPTPGTYPYVCLFHPAMTGKVIVADPSAAPDLTVSSVVAEERLPGLEQRIDVTVRNRGDGNAAASAVRVAYLYQGGEHAIAEAQVPELGPGDAATVSVTWDTTGKVGDFVLAAEADAGGDLDEEDEGNNRGEGLASVLVGGVEGIDLLDPL